jgi:hypothetical protein
MSQPFFTVVAWEVKNRLVRTISREVRLTYPMVVA